MQSMSRENIYNEPEENSKLRSDLEMELRNSKSAPVVRSVTSEFVLGRDVHLREAAEVEESSTVSFAGVAKCSSWFCFILLLINSAQPPIRLPRRRKKKTLMIPFHSHHNITVCLSPILRDLPGSQRTKALKFISRGSRKREN